MARHVVTAIMMRLLLPAALLFSLSLRPYGVSFLYLLLYLWLPLLPLPDAKTLGGWRSRVLLVNMLVSITLLLLHVAWHVFLAAQPPYGSVLETCDLLQRIAQNLGFVSYQDIDWVTAVQLLAPELVMTAASIAAFAVVNQVLRGPPTEAEIAKDNKHQQYPFLTNAGKYISLLLIMLSGILQPSVTSGIYYLVFIGAATAWAVGKELSRGYAVVCRCVMGIMAAHVAVVMAYQVDYIMELLPRETMWARIFGLTPLVEIDCAKPQDITYVNTTCFANEVAQEATCRPWPAFVSPLVILLTYYLLALETRELFKPKLIRGMSPSKKSASKRSTSLKGLHQDSTGSVIVPDNAESGSEQEKPGIMDEVVFAIIGFFQVLIRSSYIATSITMMVWSIMYHSWLAFVFLMWANVVWLRQDQRSFMLNSSPVLVFYAIFLLLSQYIYGMKLTEEELPSNVEGVNMAQIGFSRPESEAVVPLLIKSLLACMFWVTLRQRNQEAAQRKQCSAIADMAAPLQLTVSTAASVIERQESEMQESRLLTKLGELLKSACTRYWIYVVTIMLFAVGITGERMTIFRILYIGLFLVFILLFQISWRVWRRTIYAFWIVLIVYSMVNLVLVYIYQFDNFAQTIDDKLGIPVKLQYDLGLEKYDKASLFVRLLTPTCFLIITIMQVHYFHKDFMQLSDTTTESTRPSQSEGPTNLTQDGADNETGNGGPHREPTDKIQTPKTASELQPALADQDATDIDNSIEMSSFNRTRSRRYSSLYSRKKSYAPTLTEHTSIGFKECVRMGWRRFYFFYERCRDLVFLYLELHLIKFVFIALMLLCVLNVCALHVPIMLTIAPAMLLKSQHQKFCIILMSCLISAYFMAKMIYQIDYIPHSLFEVNCTELNKTYNNAEWVGFVKATKEYKLPKLLKGYITVIALFTVHSMVTYRQQRFRTYGLTGVNKCRTMFPEITRKEADSDLISCIKYLINYGFYKFGVEITLICLMGVIGSRMDLYAVFYAGWLLTLVSVTRERQACLWPAFTAFATILPMLQYMLAVGFLPQFCINYPWAGTDSQIEAVRHWVFLPYPDDPPKATKIIFDFFLLLFCARQRRVFYLEKLHGDSYVGGSNNMNIGEDWETPGFVNPVPDFMSVINSYLDVVKRLVFLGGLWLTLAIMFLAGTNRVNLFSMGYLLGSFVFLWQGTDFYLRPKFSVLKWWSWLLRYNVSVVVLKTLLQVPGCMFNTFLQENACWLVQLLGIGCIDKFSSGLKGFIKMDHYKNQETTCAVPQEDIGLAWDGVCFAFLLLQRRFFHSYYFYRVIDESKATTILASRGAELIEEQRQKQMRQQESQEMKILEKIKVKMERIKANQKKIQGPQFADAPQHDAERFLSRRYARREPASHQKAVRSGDYYMFEDFDDMDVESLAEDSESSDDEVPKEIGLGQPHRSRPTSEIPSQHPEEDHDRTDAGEPSVLAIEPPEEYTWVDKVRHLLRVSWAFLESLLVSLTRYLLRYSRDYRYVSKSLFNEKKVLKEKENFGIGIREGKQMIWKPYPEVLATRNEVTTMDEQEDSMLVKSRSPIVHLIYALWYAVLAHTDIVCYLMVFINQIQSATILSIPLPLMVFLWGTLSIPRPTKTFWVTLIAYTEVIVLLKSMFQFEVLPWNQKTIPDNMPFSAPRVIGIERKHNYALYDLLLLLIIFFHRFMLKSLGLWKETAIETDMHEDTQYALSPEDALKIEEGKAEAVAKALAQALKEKHTRDAGVQRQPQTGDQPARVDLDDIDVTREREPGTSKEDDKDDTHYEVNPDDEPMIDVTTALEDPAKHVPHMIKLTVKRYLRPMQQFFVRMLDPTARVTADVYAYMFLCDFVNFLVVIFGFAAFGTHQGDGGVKAYIEENKVPIPFLVMLILQFALIIIDRALYLRKFILGKILFQYALIIGVHIWMFFVLPFITERRFNTLVPPPMWYMVKCIYLLLSAYQIRCGYPRRIIGNFLCKSYGYLNQFAFRGFMMVPFVFELRTLMDWVWTDTSMAIMEWLKMEDIFANVFLLKCSRYVEDEFPAPRGVKRPPITKYIQGGGFLAFIIAVIWFPLVFFAFGNSVGTYNPPTDVTVNIRIGPFLPAYTMTAQSHNIELYNQGDYDYLSNLYGKDRTAQTFLSNYMYGDVAAVKLNSDSTNVWAISPPELLRLKNESNSQESLAVKMTYIITHKTTSSENPPTITEEREVSVPATVGNGTKNPARDMLYKMLEGSAGKEEWFLVPLLFPKFVKVLNKGTAKPVYQLIQSPTNNEEEMEYRDVEMQLITDKEKNVRYWRVREYCSKDNDTNNQILSKIKWNDCSQLVMFTFNDKLFPETLKWISGPGIIGLYAGLVFVASRFIRGVFSGICTKIMFEDLPNVDRLMQICLDIYLVREANELALEEALFAKLVFLYRSPETMIKWTRPRDETPEQHAIEDAPRHPDH